jgi:hypothetical protein
MSDAVQLSLGLSNQDEGAKLFEEVYAMPRLMMAFKKVRSNGGSAGPDGMSIEDFEERLTEELEGLREELQSHREAEWRRTPSQIASHRPTVLTLRFAAGSLAAGCLAPLGS